MIVSRSEVGLFPLATDLIYVNHNHVFFTYIWQVVDANFRPCVWALWNVQGNCSSSFTHKLENTRREVQDYSCIHSADDNKIWPLHCIDEN